MFPFYRTYSYFLKLFYSIVTKADKSKNITNAARNMNC